MLIRPGSLGRSGSPRVLRRLTLDLKASSPAAIVLTSAIPVSVDVLNVPDGWTLTGSVPDGLTIASDTRTIFGTPTAAGDYSFDLTATGPDGGTLKTKVKVTVSVTAATTPTGTPNQITSPPNINDFVSSLDSGLD